MVQRECAKAYHQLHEVHLCVSTSYNEIDPQQKPDHLLGFVLALTAVNLAEASKLGSTTSGAEAEPVNFLCHVYALFALRMRHSLWRHSLLSRFYMYKARCAQVKSAPIHPSLEWLLSKVGKEFVFKNNWKFGQPTSELAQVSYLYNVVVLVD